MSRNKVFTILTITLFAFKGVTAQTKPMFKGKPLEVGLMLGVSNYIGDLSKFIDFKQTSLAGGIICRFNLNDYVTLRGSTWFGQISGTDKNYESDATRKARNLSFKSDIFEFSGTIEWNLLGFEETQKGTPWSPYLFAGLGVYKYNPKAQFKYLPGVINPSTGLPIHSASLAVFNNKWIELQPMATEGQESTKYNSRKRYALTQASLPIGFGFKKQFNNKWAIGLEAGIRFTTNDYIDDVSKKYADFGIVGANNREIAQVLADRGIELALIPNEDNVKRGTSTTPDFYTFMGLTLTRKLGGSKQVCFSFD